MYALLAIGTVELGARPEKNTGRMEQRINQEQLPS